MNKIKAVKIKEEDGSLSDESYIIAADAVNIDMDNGENLQDTVGNIDIDQDGNIARQLKNANRNLSELNIAIEKKPYYYNTTIDMLNDSDLKVGDMCVTSGYYEINDGGGATFIVSSTRDLSLFQLDFGNLYLNIIQEDNSQINCRKFGLKDNVDKKPHLHTR